VEEDVTQSLRGIMEEESWRKDHGGGICLSGRRNQEGEIIMEEKSWKRIHGRGIREEKSWSIGGKFKIEMNSWSIGLRRSRTRRNPMDHGTESEV